MTSPRPPSPTRTPLRLAVLGGVAFLLSCGLALGPLDGLPHVSDEVAYLLQARTFASLRAVGDPAVAPSLVTYPMIGMEPGLHGAFPPGWPLLLSLGVALGWPLGLNPLLASLLPWATWRLARHLAPDAALVAATLTALSPGVILLAASRMSQTSTLLALLLLAGTVVAAPCRRSQVLLGAAAAAWVVATRPFDGLVLAGPLLALLLWRQRDGWTWGLGLSLPALAVAGVLAFNHATTGHPLTFPGTAFWDGFVPERPGCDRLGFGPQVGCVPVQGSWGYTPAKALGALVDSLVLYDRLFLGIPGGSLAVLAGAWSLARGRGAAGSLPFFLPFLVPLAYLLYWSPGHAFGARFYHPLYVATPTLAALALVRVGPGLRTGLLVATSLAGLTLAGRDLSRGYWCVDGAVRDVVRGAGVDGVVFLHRTGTHPGSWPWLGASFTCDPMLASGSAFGWRGPDLEEGVRFRHLTADPAQATLYMEEVHPGEAAWVLEGPVGQVPVLVPLADYLAARQEGAPEP